MSTINIFADLKNKENNNNLFTAVGYESNLMMIQLIDDSIAGFNKIISNDSGDYTEDEIKVAKDKKKKAEAEKQELINENEKNSEVYSKVISVVTDSKNEYTRNDKIAFRNILRIIACGDNKRFFKLAVLAGTNDDNEIMKDLYNLFTTCHSLDGNFNDDGMRLHYAVEFTAHSKISEIIQKYMREMFSIPVENEYTKKVTTRFNKQDLAILHECFVTGYDFKTKKNKNGTLTVGEGEYKTSISKKTNKDGKEKYDSVKFRELLAKIVFQKLYK